MRNTPARFASEKKPWRAANENSTSCSRFAAKPRLGLCGNFKMRWFAIWWTAPWPPQRNSGLRRFWCLAAWPPTASRSEEHTSELQSHSDLVCRLLLEKKKKNKVTKLKYRKTEKDTI